MMQPMMGAGMVGRMGGEEDLLRLMRGGMGGGAGMTMPMQRIMAKMMQQILDQYNSGIEITQVQAQKSDPPAQVIDSIRDVQAAKADKERQQNEAQAYANDVIPRARGEAAKIVQEAEGYKKEVVAQAEGEASRFIAKMPSYWNSEVT